MQSNLFIQTAFNKSLSINLLNEIKLNQKFQKNQISVSIKYLHTNRKGTPRTESQCNTER